MSRKMTNVMERVQKHYDCAVEHYGADAVLGVFLYGSWNYGTNLPDSDVDTKCILVPDLFHLAIKPYEIKHLHVDNEVCECMTIMHMVANWKKQNINFVEIMFTDYCIINSVYKEKWKYWISSPTGLREAVARYDIAQAVNSMAHQALHTMKQDSTDLKKLMNAARVSDAIARLTTHRDMSYKCVIWDEKVRGIRTGEMPVHEYFVRDMEIFFEDMIQKAPQWAPDKEHREALDSCLNDVIIDLIKHRMSF